MASRSRLRILLSRIGPRAAVELFVLGNLAFLAVDVWLAHSYNQFAHWAEWIPFFFSLGSPVLLAVALRLGGLAEDRPGPGRWIGLALGATSVVIGVAGMVFHLESTFFAELTIANLVYTAPFAAPLAYAGLGLILVLDRMVDPEDAAWARWVVLLALGGFVGNFALSLADHAQNGFFHAEEWIAVVASALGVGFLTSVVIWPGQGLTRRIAGWVMLGEIGVGVLGLVFHVRANLHGPMDALYEDFLYGAPAFAPLLFADIALLGLLGLWGLSRVSTADAADVSGSRAPAPSR